MIAMNIFPAPSECTEKEGSFVFSESETLYFVISENVKNTFFKKKCSELWKNFTAGKSDLKLIETAEFSDCAFILKSKENRPNIDKTDYEYVLECSRDGIGISYSGEEGLIHAFSTLLQMIGPYSNKNKNFNIPCCIISDRPVLRMRGIHLCVFPETPLLFLQKAVRLCGLLKYSHMILEFWGMYKFRFMEELGWRNGYSADELRTIIEDGKAFGMEFIPMFNHLGHAAQSRFKAGKNVLIDNAPQFEEYFEPGGWTWKVSMPEVRELLRSARAELCELFGEGGYFHVGCDEAYICDGDDDGMDEAQNRNFVEFLNSTAREIAESGRKMIMWGDMFLDRRVFQFPYCHNVSNRCADSERNLEALDKDIVIDDWQYNIGIDRDESVKYFLERRDPGTIVLSPWEGYNNVSAAENINGRCALAKRHSLLGVIATTWNTAQRDTKNIIYAACQMWSEDDGYADRRTWEVYKCFGMQNLRKLLPSGGDMKKSGWLEGENIIPYI